MSISPPKNPELSGWTHDSPKPTLLGAAKLRNRRLKESLKRSTHGTIRENIAYRNVQNQFAWQIIRNKDVCTLDTVEFFMAHLFCQ